MAIASPATPSFSASFCCAPSSESQPKLARLHSLRRIAVSSPFRQLTVSSRLKPSSASGAGGSVSPDNGGDLQHELFSPQQQRTGSPVFVTLPTDAVGEAGQVRRRKATWQAFRALAAAGVEGVVVEVWWGLVEKDRPLVYDWQGYLEIVALARRSGLKVRAVMAFHQCGTGPGDPHWIPLPPWVLEEIDKDPDLAYSDRFGRRSMEYISLGCDTLPVLRGRSPIQAYTDFMRNFRDAFRPFLGAIITGVQVGMGPAGELRYPSCPSQKLTWGWRSRELGEFQCYDKYMLASLNACAREIGKQEWGDGGPIGSGNLMHDPEQTEFFRSENGSWNSPYGKFFLHWYSSLLLLHAERLCSITDSVFHGTKVNPSAKIAGIHWHYTMDSHPSELTAGYYNTATRDGLEPIARLFGRHSFTLCCSGFEIKDKDEKPMNPNSSPEGFLRQLLLAAKVCDVAFEGENRAANLDDSSFEQVAKMSRFYSEGSEKNSLSFNFVRMDKYMFEYQNWVRFTRFVRQMSGSGIFRARLGFRGEIHRFLTYRSEARVGFSFVC